MNIARILTIQVVLERKLIGLQRGVIGRIQENGKKVVILVRK
jgi:hypothetical protein